MTNRYTKRHSKISEDKKIPQESVTHISPFATPSVKALRNWANRQMELVAKSQRDMGRMSALKTYKIPGSSGNVYTITISKDSVNCSCPGFTYRRRCKHISENSYIRTPKGL